MRILTAAILALLPTVSFACGPDTDCMIGDRSYRIAMPDGITNPGALVYAHGYRGSAQGAMRNMGLRKLANEFGLALIAANGVNGGWDLPGRPGSTQSDGSSEFAYFEAVLDDAQSQHGIDPDNIIATGFSAGGMMTWNLVCARSDLFRGAIPMSGTFWESVPDSCTTDPISVIHIHGDNDGTVPLSGRVIRDSKQGDVPTALGMYAGFGGFTDEVTVGNAGMNCAVRENTQEQTLGFCTFGGGHSFRLEHLRAALEMLEQE
jgi:polyhydroxybutyrate depolymerase